jgi:membrane-bound lytic murein transglycosylase A
MQVIRDWLRRHPDQAGEWMNRNPRFIFFQEVKGNGPVGAMNVTLSAGRSLAIDPAFMPLGAPVWLDTFWPIDSREAKQGQPFRRLMLAQDVGSAIKGPVRGDIFWGSGEKALAFAGTMRQKGRWFLLLPVAAAQRQTLDLVDVMGSPQ